MSDDIRDKITPRVRQFLWQRASWLASDPGRSAAQEELLGDLAVLLGALGEPLDFEPAPLLTELRASDVPPVVDPRTLIWCQYILNEPKGVPWVFDITPMEIKKPETQWLLDPWGLPAIEIKITDRKSPKEP